MSRAIFPITFALGLVLLLSGCAQNAPTTPADLDPPALASAFEKVPDADKPWCYWWWLKANVDEKSITADLEAMKAKGFGGLLMFDARGYHEGHVVPPPSRTDFMSDRWRQLLKYSMKEANRLGLQFSINLSSHAGALTGPWPVGPDAPKKLIWASTEFAGPKEVKVQIKKPAPAPKDVKRELNQPDGACFWDIAVLAVRQEAPRPDTRPTTQPAGNLAGPWNEINAKPRFASPALEVVDLSKKIDPAGNLTWYAPPGNWTILRFASTTMPGHEYDVDVIDPRCVTGHFNRMGKAILEDAGDLVGKTLTHFYSVSWEGAAPTWTLAMEAEFAKYRGYAIREWLPTLAGVTIKDRAASDRFLRDYHKTLGDMFMNNFYGTLNDLCRANGLKWHSESGGPWDRKLPDFEYADQLAYLARNDMPQCEFWFNGKQLGRAINRPAAMAAHIYGKRLAATEAFTHMVQHWSTYPALLKPNADAAFCDGINQFVWHTFSASPPEFGKPGIEYFAGTHINPNVTWFNQAGPFIQYLGRCQVMLRQGKFVADVCTYIGDNPYQHWGRGEKWSPKSTMQLAKGYTYDLVTTEVLLERIVVKDGKLVLPGGMMYRALVVDLDEEVVLPAVLKKIDELTRAGATVVLGHRRPTFAPGLAGFPSADEQVRQLSAALWGTSTSAAPPVSAPKPSATPSAGHPVLTPLGKGRLITGATNVDEILRADNILPDCEGPTAYTHRRTGETDIYFVTGKGPVECTFRVSGKDPELWNPATGERRLPLQYRTTEDGRMIVPLNLPENGATFVVFQTSRAGSHIVQASGPDNGIGCTYRASAEEGKVSLWRNGKYTFDRSHAPAKPATQPSHKEIEVKDLPDPLAIAGPWTVEFEPGRGAPAVAKFDKLVPLNEHADEGIKFFSGRAVYRTTFTATAQQAKNLARLQLGEVMCLAEVKLNGQPLGIVWTDPWAVELVGVKAGPNELVIAVTNTWVNRLIGDAALPPEKRITKTNVAYEPGERKLKIYQSFAAKDKLMPSGLIGPVRIEFGVSRSIPLVP